MEITLDDVRRALTQLAEGGEVMVVFDEFDRLSDKSITLLMADTIKSLSDYAVPATILLIGVAGSVDELVVGHQSIERALIQIPMPGMSGSEIGQIIRNGLTRLKMTIDQAALDEMVALSQGLPYITHLLALTSVRATLVSDAHECNQSRCRSWNPSVSGSMATVGD